MEIVIVNVVSFCILAAFIFHRFKISRSILEPGIVFAINLIILYPLRAIVLYIFAEQALPDFPGADVVENISDTSWMAMLGIIGYVIGYLALMRRRDLLILNSTHQVSKLQEDLVAITIMFFLSLIGVTYKILTGDYISYLLAENKVAGLAHIGTLLTSLQWPAYIGVWILWFKGYRTKEFKFLFFVVVIVVISYQFIQGSKTFLSLLMLSTVISYYWSARRFPRFAAILSIYIITTLVFPFVQSFREYINSDYGKIPSISKLNLYGVIAYSEEAQLLEEEEETDSSIFKVSARFGGIDQLYGMTVMVPTVLDYQYGADYFSFFVNLIPRAAWPDKPEYSRGAKYGQALGTMTSVTPFPIGEAYWDFGLVGVFLMMAVWGLSLALVSIGYDRLYKQTNYSLIISTYFLYQIYWISGGETSMPMVIASIPQQAALLWLIFFIKNSVSKHNFSRNIA